MGDDWAKKEARRVYRLVADNAYSETSEHGEADTMIIARALLDAYERGYDRGYDRGYERGWTGAGRAGKH